MLEEIFRQGSLEMSSSPLQVLAQEPIWADVLVNRIAVTVSVLVFFILLTDYLRLVPSWLACVSRFRANITLEHSVSLARSRNYIAAFSVLPACLTADRYGLFAPSFLGDVAPGWHVPIIMAAVMSCVIVRRLLYLVINPRRLNSEELNSVRHAPYNYMVILVTALVLTLLVAVPAGLSDAAIKTVMMVETVLVSMLSLVRCGQIFAAHCGGLTTFLYLCALEMMPLGILIFINTR